MKKKVIALWARGGTGKTTTLRSLIDKLVNLHSAKIISVHENKYQTDCCAVLGYKGRKIGIITNGDTAEVLKNGFGLLPDDCDIYICACRTKGGPCDYVKEYVGDGMLVWIEKSSVTSPQLDEITLEKLQADANEAQANEMIRIIDTI